MLRSARVPCTRGRILKGCGLPLAWLRKVVQMDCPSALALLSVLVGEGCPSCLTLFNEPCLVGLRAEYPTHMAALLLVQLRFL
jgi:hypothetical protein